MRTANGNRRPPGEPARRPEPARSLAWVVRQVNEQAVPFQPIEHAGRFTRGGPDREELLAGFGSVQVLEHGLGEAVGPQWQPTWEVASGPSLQPATFRLSFDTTTDDDPDPAVQINEWPVPAPQFSVPLYPGAGPQRVFARVTDVGELGSLASVLAFDIETTGGASPSGPAPAVPDTDPPDRSGRTRSDPARRAGPAAGCTG